MVALARRLHPGLEFREADAHALEQGIPERQMFGGGTATGLVDDLLIAGHQLGVGEGVQQWAGPEEVIGVTMGKKIRTELPTSIVPARRGMR